MKLLTFILGIVISISVTSCSQATAEEFFKSGNDFYRQKDYKKAIEQYDKAIDKENDFVTAYINKGQALEFERKFQEAIDNYDALLKIMPDQTEVLTRRGITYGKIQNFQQAIIDLEKANKQDPDNPEILSNLGVCKVRTSDTSGIKDLDRSITLDPTNSSAFYHRGLGKIMMQLNEEGIEDFEKSISLKPDFGEVYFSIGLAKSQLGDMDGACDYWKQSVKKGYGRAQAIIDQNCNNP